MFSTHKPLFKCLNLAGKEPESPNPGQNSLISNIRGACAHAEVRVDSPSPHSRGRSVAAKLTATIVTSYMWRVKREASPTPTLSSFSPFTRNNFRVHTLRK